MRFFLDVLVRSEGDKREWRPMRPTGHLAPYRFTELQAHQWCDAYVRQSGKPAWYRIRPENQPL